MQDQPKFDTDGYFDFEPFGQPMKPLDVSSPEYVQNNNFSRNQVNNLFKNQTEHYVTSPKKDWYHFSNLQSDQDLFTSNLGNPQRAAENTNLSPENAFVEYPTLTITRPLNELSSTAGSDYMTSADLGTEGKCNKVSQEFEIVYDRSQDQDDDHEFTDWNRKKVHVDETAKLEAIVKGCDLLSSTAQLSTNDTTHEDGNIQIKIAKKRGRPRKNIAEKHVNETFVDFLKNSPNEYDKIWSEEDPRFELFFRFPEIEQIILDMEKICKKKQNSKRNIPGLIFNRVIKNMLDVLQNNDISALGFKLYIVKILTDYCVGGIEFSGLVSYLKSLHIQGRTWESITTQIRENSMVGINSFYGGILLKCIDAFLSSTGENDFNAWINNPNCRLKENAKAVLREHKHKKDFREKFIKIKSGLAFII